MRKPLEEQKAQEKAEFFDRIVLEHRRAVFAVAFAKLRNVHDAEDVMQEVFIEAYRNSHKLKDSAKTLPWLFKATSYRCKDHRRRNARREKREATYAQFSLSVPSTDSAEGEEHHDAVVQAIGQLPEKFRIVIMLKHFSRLSYAEIGKMTGLSKTTIDGRLRTAKKELRQKLAEIKKRS